MATMYAIYLRNCPLVHDHPDLRGHQPDPARGDGPPAPEERVTIVSPGP